MHTTVLMNRGFDDFFSNKFYPDLVNEQANDSLFDSEGGLYQTFGKSLAKSNKRCFSCWANA